MMSVLSIGLNPSKDDNPKGILHRENSRPGIKDTIVLSLEGLHKAATLSNVLGNFVFKLKNIFLNIFEVC